LDDKHLTDVLSIFWSYLNDKRAFKDLSALKSKDDLVTKVVAKYGLDKTQAQCDVDALLKGRHI
jgi:hypothetical protein